jgi:hypothetical protein
VHSLRATKGVEMRIFGFEYRVVKGLDFLNITTIPNHAGVEKVNNLAIQGWVPWLVLRSDAIGFKTDVMFRRRKWFHKKQGFTKKTLQELGWEE